MTTVRLAIKNRTNSGGRKGWTRLVTSVDKAKTNGYAFAGQFLNDQEYDLAPGDVLVEKNPEGSAKHGWDAGVCRAVSPAGGLWRTHAETFRWDKQFLSFRDHVAAVLALSPAERLRRVAADRLERCRAAEAAAEASLASVGPDAADDDRRRAAQDRVGEAARDTETWAAALAALRPGAADPKADAVAKVRAVMADLGVTVADLGA